jgi:hypothetical protein
LAATLVDRRYPSAALAKEAPSGELPELTDVTDLRVMQFFTAHVRGGDDTANMMIFAMSIQAVPDGAGVDDLGNSLDRLSRLGLIKVNRDGDVKVLERGKQWIEQYGASIPPMGVPDNE